MDSGEVLLEPSMFFPFTISRDIPNAANAQNPIDWMTACPPTREMDISFLNYLFTVP
jgi:hypothetical protein